jgi:tetratricopeptide (TPR) repeat protein
VVRIVVVVVAVVLVIGLGAVQLASSAAYGDLAARVSLPAVLHAADPALLRPLLGDAYARAAAAIHDGDLAGAERLVATLPDDAATADLRGQIAQARGERDAAIADYVRAGDVTRAQALIDGIVATEPDRALADQQLLVAALRGDPSAGEVTGQAWWRLGQLQAAQGDRDPSQRAATGREAETSYERALALAPNEETYLLAAGYQSLANGDRAAATRWYTRAAEVVPNSADAFAGLAWTAALAGDCARARTSLDRARALRAQQGSTVRDPLADPVGGPALARCTT